MSQAARRPRTFRLRRARWLRRRASRLDPTVRGMLWVSMAGFLFVMLNTTIRTLTLQMHPMQAQFLRYFASVLIMLPLVARAGLAAYRPSRIGGQFGRGAMHAVGLMLWFTALAKIPLAETTAIGFMGPIFIMLGAFLVFRERMHWDRWVAALMGFAGVLIVVGPSMVGAGSIYSLVMLASCPVFAASFLMTKALTRTDRAEVIVFWQAVSVSCFSLPLALWYWAPLSPAHLFAFLLAGVIGVVAHYCITRGFAVADISSTQSVKFLDLVWSASMGWLVFSEVPNKTTLIGGLVICGSTIWIAHREARGRRH